MGNSDKETVAEMPVPAAEPVQNNETAPTGSTPAVAETISAPTETNAAEATRSLEGPSAMPSALPPTYEEYVAHTPRKTLDILTLTVFKRNPSPHPQRQSPTVETR